MWFYVQHILIPHQRAEAALHEIPRGNLSDLYPRWLGARELLLHHRDPYSKEVTREIQVGYYGRQLDPARPSDPKDQQAFAYPAYVVFLLAPTVLLSFSTVQAGFRLLLLGLTIATVFLWMRTFRWRISPMSTAILIVLTIGSFPVMQGIKLQQLSLLVAGLIAISALLIAREYFALAGVVLALTTIKPQLVVLLVAWLSLWAFADWRRRQNLVWGFVVTMVFLCVAAQCVIPGWSGRFLNAVIAYRQYNDGAGSVLEVLVTPVVGRMLAGLAVIALGTTTWKSRRASVDSSAFHWMFALVLALTVVVVPKTAPYNQVFLLPAVLFVAANWRDFCERGIGTRFVLVLCGLLVCWPWLAAAGLTLASFGLAADTIQQAWAVPIWTSLLIPLAVLAALTRGYNKFSSPTIDR
jgi:hypothetical protein